jgi:hypothetical protein
MNEVEEQKLYDDFSQCVADKNTDRSIPKCKTSAEKAAWLKVISENPQYSKLRVIHALANAHNRRGRKLSDISREVQLENAIARDEAHK